MVGEKTSNLNGLSSAGLQHWFQSYGASEKSSNFIFSFNPKEGRGKGQKRA